MAVALGSALTLIAAAPAGAAEWTIGPALEMRGEYNDNVRLRPSDENIRSVRVARLLPLADMRVREPNWEASVEGRLDLQRYTGADDAEDLDRENGRLGIASTYNTPRTTWGLEGRYEVDTTLQDELTSDLGLVTEQIERTTKQVAPRVGWAITPRTRLKVDLRYQEVSIDDEAAGLSDFQYGFVTAALSRELSRRLTLSGALGYSVFDVLDKTRFQAVVFTGSAFTTGQIELEGAQAKTASLRVGGSYEVSPTLSFDLAVGARRTKTRFEVAQAVFFTFPPFSAVIGTREETISSTGFLINGELRKRFQRTDLSLKLSRDLSPSIDGGLDETDTVTLGVERRISPAVKAGLTLEHLQTEEATGAATQSDEQERTVLRIAPRIIWRPNRRWSVVAKYTHTRLDRGNREAMAKQNLMSLSLEYTWPRASIPD
ncbi:MAG: hypothetical protein GWO40_16070 [Gammaproteobacteria bacterium]|nr:hypothetical protein [Gemmatimonadota bacterium]NIR84733.1 hypothetical protein [Gammaproteobacteria bacterium]NIU05774.1 hypothetical protein [Gammaproteobacteria bacterium]NIV52897.1 hypothetical protein [Gammaproteobacteria bacterium]NIX87047.1 hypothetical protein [Gammaproteobacteria bacterium]